MYVLHFVLSVTEGTYILLNLTCSYIVRKVPAFGKTTRYLTLFLDQSDVMAFIQTSHGRTGYSSSEISFGLSPPVHR